MLAKKNIFNRRDFIKSGTLLGLGFAIGLDAKANVLNISGCSLDALAFEFNPFIIIRSDGSITIVNPRPDMGQGTAHAVPALIAEELEVDLAAVNIIPSDGKSKYGKQTAGGSSSIRDSWIPLRKTGAAAREMLIKAAAKRWSVAESQCYASGGKVHLKNGNASFSYGELAEEASKLEVPVNPTLKDPNEFKIIGKNIKRKDVPLKVTGAAVYGLDIEVPEMVHAVILHSPMIYGKVVSVDESAALKVPGVLQVLKCEHKMIHCSTDAVAVIASNWWAAKKGRDVLKVKWDNANLEKELNTSKYFDDCYEAAQREGIVFENKNDFDTHFSQSQSRLEQIYETPFLAHVPVEPLNATAHVKDDGTVEIWAPIQGPGETLNEVAEYLKLPHDKIKIHATFLGGSYGRKAYVDFVLEACYLSNILKKPVKVAWTKEDDVTQGPYRPGMLSKMQGFVKEGKIAGFHHHFIGESIARQVFTNLPDGEADTGICEEFSTRVSKYQFKEGDKISWTTVKTEIPIMWWRAVYNSNLGWGQECFIDELAHLAGKDPLQARLDILDDQRFVKVLETLAEKSGYHSKTPAGSGKGIAIYSSFGSICACCITVSKVGNGIKINDVVAIMDCGTYVSLDTVKAQTEGNIVMGLSAAIKGGIKFKNGLCQQSNFNNYQVMRINETPNISVYLMENGEKPGGVGEAGLPPVAPALGNAIFAATGKRIRKLPVDIDDLNE